LLPSIVLPACSVAKGGCRRCFFLAIFVARDAPVCFAWDATSIPDSPLLGTHLDPQPNTRIRIWLLHFLFRGLALGSPVLHCHPLGILSVNLPPTLTLLKSNMCARLCDLPTRCHCFAPLLLCFCLCEDPSQHPDKLPSVTCHRQGHSPCPPPPCPSFLN